MGKTLVYIASGPYNPAYEKIPYDRVFLVDTYFKKHPQPVESRNGKVTCLPIDALDSVDYFKEEGIQIDCLVCLCESIDEGGHTYSTCSDMFMGYIMPILARDFIWIRNDINYYPSRYRAADEWRRADPDLSTHRIPMRDWFGFNFVSMDLPYTAEEILEGDLDYLPPSLFSRELTEKNPGHVFWMHYSPIVRTFPFPGGVTIRLIQDSIWNHHEELDHLFISFKPGYIEKEDFFERKDKVSYYRYEDFEKILRTAAGKGLSHIGFTPHHWFQFDQRVQKQMESFLREQKEPLTIDFYFMNAGFHTRYIQKAIKTILREIPATD